MNDRLVCLDCLKTNPVHLSAHGQSMVRVEDFLQRLSQTSATDSQLKHLSLMADGLRMQIEGEKVYRRDLTKQIEVYFESVQTHILEVTRKCLSDICSRCVSQVETLSSEHVGNLQASLEEANELLKFRNKGQLLDLFLALDKSGSQVDVRKKINKIVSKTFDLDSSIAEWMEVHKSDTKTANKKAVTFEPDSAWRSDVCRRVREAITTHTDYPQWKGWILSQSQMRNKSAAGIATDGSGTKVVGDSRINSPEKDIEDQSKERRARLADIDRRIESLLRFYQVYIVPAKMMERLSQFRLMKPERLMCLERKSRYGNT